jgi:hypothetical protein
MRAVDKLTSDQQSVHDNEQLALAIASVDHVRSQKQAATWTAMDADAIRAIWGVLCSLHDAKSATELPKSFAPGQVASPPNPVVAAARLAVEKAVAPPSGNPEAALSARLTAASQA